MRMLRLAIEHDGVEVGAFVEQPLRMGERDVDLANRL